MNVHEKFSLFFNDIKLRPFAYLVSKKLADGHTCINKNENYSSDFEDVIYQYKDLDWTELNSNALVSITDNDKKPFVFYEDNLYLYRYFNYESQIVSNIKTLISEEKEQYQSRKSFLTANAEYIKKPQVVSDNDNVSNVEKIDWQLVACINSFLSNFSIITGGPGTGKTTTVAKLLALLYKENENLKVALSAPTGKAGNRMLESLSTNNSIENFGIKDKIDALKPFTIHRLLGDKRNSTSFKHDSNNSLNYDVVIVDEASMVDMALFSKLLESIKPTSRIIFLGDKEQLASVEAGSLFGDLCNSLDTLNELSEDNFDFINTFLKVENKLIDSFKQPKQNNLLFGHIIDLKRSYRFDIESEIGNLSKAIINSKVDDVSDFFNDKQTVKIDVDYNDSTLREFVKTFDSYVEEEDTKKALEILNNSKILCAVKQGKNGVYEVNKKIEQIFKGKLKTNQLFYENRPILVTKNYKDLDLFNGDIGIIRNDEACFLNSNNEIEKVRPALIAECETVFAMTIHKSQGSEYNNVLVILPESSENKLLTKELLYTAVTRAKKNVTIQATKEVVLSTVQKSVKRSSGIIAKIK